MKPSDAGWLTPTQACRTLGITVQDLYALIDSGALPAYRIGSRIRLRTADVREYLDRRDAGDG